jgi:perosamine synthetase
MPDITPREVDAVVDVLHTPALSGGPRLEQFEEACAFRAGRRHAVGVSSGTAGLHCALLAAGVKEGDEVITTPFSFVASANCALYVGARPVFADINPVTLNLDVERVQAAITPRTRAIVGVEVFGQPGGMRELEQIARRHELVLIEDACEGFGGSTGSRAIGSFGRAGVFGYPPDKQITTGEGGMIVTDDEVFAASCRALRNQGREGMAWLSHQRLGYNYRLSEIGAALGLSQVERLDEILDRRRIVANGYIERLMTNRHLILPTIDSETRMSWYVFVVRLNDLFEPGDRDEVMRQLRAEGIGCNNYFPPIHLQPYMMQMFGHKPGDFPVTEYVAARTLALPFFTRMTPSQIQRVCETLERILDRMRSSGLQRF